MIILVSKIDFNSGTSNDGTTFKEELSSSQFAQGSDFSFDTMQNENTTGNLSQWLAGFLVKKYNIKATNIKKFIAAHSIQIVDFKLNGLPSNPFFNKSTISR